MIAPIGIDFVSWADQLRIDYSDALVPQAADASLWANWADQVSILPIFSQYNVPDSFGYETWDQWASVVYYLMP